jgi:NTP pyrophosphatase (non-canonical NTP hydrolase)
MEIKIDNFAEYKKLAAVTDNPQRLTKFENEAHYIFGIWTEIQELSDATDTVNRDEEIGDILWYIARYDVRHDLNLDYMIDETFHFGMTNGSLETTFYPNISALRRYMAEITNYQKRHMAYQEEFKRHEVEICFHSFLICLRNCTDKSFKQICEANIKKLANRKQFAEKFDAVFGSVRDTDAELAILTNSFL